MRAWILGALLLLGLTPTLYATSVTLAWDPPVNQPCALIGYNIFRSNTSGTYDKPFNGDTPIATQAPPVFVDTTVQAGQVYFYVVRALCDNVESANSNEVKADLNLPPPPPPTGMSAFCLGGGTTAVLGWDVIAGATYTVSWNDKTDPTIKGEISQTPTATLYINTTPGHSYRWSVTAATGAVAQMDFTCYALQPPANIRISQ